MSDDLLNKKNIQPVEITDIMKKSYIDYAMSVIVSRALPDVRDGLKPVQRRILYAMNELGLVHNKPHRKSATIVGEVIGKYHPHGIDAIYLAMVHLAEKWSLRYTLVDGQGNFGSIDGDSPAAMRYTEARMHKLAEEMLCDIDKDTIDWDDNFDETKKEPSVLPAKLPNLLINGTVGVAVGMSTEMAPHNLKEVCDAIIAYIDNKDITVPEIMSILPGPDFPTGAIICGTRGIMEAYTTGKGRVLMRANAEIHEINNSRFQIIVTELPFMVNKAELIQHIAELVYNKKIEGISDIRDESDKSGLCIAIDLKREAVPQIVLNNLFKNTKLEYAFNINNVCLVNSKPMRLGIKDIIKYFYEHRHSVVVRRVRFELEQAKRRMHIIEGYIIALDNIDPIIALIKASEDNNVAIRKMAEKYNLDDIQAKSILEMKLQRLTGLERDKVKKEYDELVLTVKRLEEILANDTLVQNIIKDELIDIKVRYGDKRKTLIQKEEVNAMNFRDIIPDENVVITLSDRGYMKRTLLSEYRLQNRGGVGVQALVAKEDDYVKYISVSSTHKFLFVFTTKGFLYWKNVYDIPEGARNTKGKHINNIFPIVEGDKISCVLNVDNIKDEEYINTHYLLFCTRNGIIKKTILKSYVNVRSNGIKAIRITNDDELLDVKITDGNKEVILATYNGKVVRFDENCVKHVGRNSIGVKGIKVDKNNTHNDDDEDNSYKGAHDVDRVVGIIIVDKNEKDKTILVVSEKGYGKRSRVEGYRLTSRNAKGVITMHITPKTGKLVAVEDVESTDELMIIKNFGAAIRIQIKNIPVSGRNTQGVILVKLNKKEEYIKSIAKIENI